MKIPNPHAYFKRRGSCSGKFSIHVLVYFCPDSRTACKVPRDHMKNDRVSGRERFVQRAYCRKGLSNRWVRQFFAGVPMDLSNTAPAGRDASERRFTDFKTDVCLPLERLSKNRPKKQKTGGPQRPSGQGVKNIVFNAGAIFKNH